MRFMFLIISAFLAFISGCSSVEEPIFKEGFVTEVFLVNHKEYDIAAKIQLKFGDEMAEEKTKQIYQIVRPVVLEIIKMESPSWSVPDLDYFSQNHLIFGMKFCEVLKSQIISEGKGYQIQGCKMLELSRP